MKEYQSYTVRDFTLDENFQNWVLHPDIKNMYFWEQWIQQHPQKADAINDAVKLVRSIGFQSYTLSNIEKESLWESVWDKMDEVETEVVSDIPVSLKMNTPDRKWKYAVAAGFIGLMVLSVFWLKTDRMVSKTISFSSQTGFGEVKKLLLPDSSEVTLNAYSRLVYAEKENSDREVWIDGEAFFQVKHTVNNKKFIVHTFDKLSVEVLGTSFNVNSKGNEIAVVLQEGSIKVEIDEGNAREKTQMYLKPGEMVSYNKKFGDYSKREVAPEKYDSWASGKLMMNDYTLEQAATFMQQVFGKKIIIRDSTLVSSKISGSMPIIYNVDTMLVQFGKVFKVRFQKKNNEIWVEK